MNKPSNYDNVSVGDFTPVELGGHTAFIRQVSERDNKNGRPMVVVLLDFDKTDKQPNYFMDSFHADIRPEKKYPNQGTQYINCEDQNGECSKSFKKFLTCVEKSNANFKVNWDAKDFGAQFKNKKVGVVFGNVEEEYNGEVKMRRKIRWFCEYDKAKSATIPDDKLLNISNSNSTTNASEGYINTPTGTQDELPF